jgi:hypothetical protein
MNYSFLPQKVVDKIPIISEENQTCPTCNAKNKSFPLFNMHGSIRYCTVCKETFDPQITGYKEVIRKINTK